MFAKKRFSVDQARRAGEEIGIDWATASFDVEQFCRGMNVELEHGLCDPLTNVTHDDPVVTAKIVLAHLKRTPNYYTRLERTEGGVAEAQTPSVQTEPTEEPAEEARSSPPVATLTSATADAPSSSNHGTMRTSASTADRAHCT